MDTPLGTPLPTPESSRFPTTRWTLVHAARNLKALETLISLYWKPLYFFVRHHRHDLETSQDIVQEFLATLLERKAISRADPARGRFRTFLLTSLSNFMKDWARSASRQKRGSGRPLFSLDFARGEKDYALQVAAGETPEVVLNRAWARSLWEKALSELQGEPSHLEAFRQYLEDADYRTISERTGLSESAAKTAVHRLKVQLREIIVGHIRETVSTEDDLQAEIAEFKALLS